MERTTAEQIAEWADVSVEDLPKLTMLLAGDNSGITDAGLAHVPNLTTLYAVGNSGITDAGFARRNRAWGGGT